MTIALPNNGNLFLCGFMGSGKSTIGPIAARELGLPFIDTDRLVVILSGKTIPEIFESEGEDTFRRWEQKAVKQVCGVRGHVVALGGGTLTDPDNQRLVLTSGEMIYLKGTMPKLLGRIVASERPKLKNLKGEALTYYLSELLKAREPDYHMARMEIDTDEKSMVEVVREIIRGVSTWKR
jgi:shikimate kinase